MPGAPEIYTKVQGSPPPADLPLVTAYAPRVLTRILVLFNLKFSPINRHEHELTINPVSDPLERFLFFFFFIFSTLTRKYYS